MEECRDRSWMWDILQEGASSQEIEEEISQLNTWISAFYAVAPNDGTYFNEARAGHIISQLSVC